MGVAQLIRRRHLERRRTDMTRCGLKLKSRSGMAMWDGLWPICVDLPVPHLQHRLRERFVCDDFKMVWAPTK